MPSHSLAASIAAAVLMVVCGCLSLCDARAAPFTPLPRSQPIALNLTHRAFPLQPGPAAAAWLPPLFDPSTQWTLIVHFHGFHNCVMNAVGNVSMSCTAAQPPRVPYATPPFLHYIFVTLGQVLPRAAARRLRSKRAFTSARRLS